MTNPQPGQLRIVTKYHWLAFMFAFFKPIATINGHTVKLAWGENLIPAAPGVHQITIHIPYLWKVGVATITVDNSGAVVPTVHYSAPVWAFGGGAIGYEPQKHPGMVPLMIIYGVLAAVIVLCCCGSFIASMVNGGSSTY